MRANKKQMCAGRVGQLLNLNSLGNDAGVSHTTARDWMNMLEASFVVFRAPSNGFMVLFPPARFWSTAAPKPSAGPTPR